MALKINGQLIAGTSILTVNTVPLISVKIDNNETIVWREYNGPASPITVTADVTLVAGIDFPADMGIKLCMCGGGGSGAATDSEGNASGGGRRGQIVQTTVNVSFNESVVIDIGGGGGIVSGGDYNGNTGGTTTFGSYASASGGGGGSAGSACDTAYTGTGGSFISPCDGVTYRDGAASRNCGNYYGLGGQAGAFGSGGAGNDYDPAGGGGVGAGGGGVTDSSGGGEPSGPGGRGQVVISW